MDKRNVLGRSENYQVKDGVHFQYQSHQLNLQKIQYFPLATEKSNKGTGPSEASFVAVGSGLKGMLKWEQNFECEIH